MYEAYAASKIGNTNTQNFLTAAWSAAIAVTTDTLKQQPILFTIYTNQDLYIVQGSATMSDPSTLTEAGLIKADAYWPIVIESDADRYVKLRGASSNGQARFTNVTYLGAR